MSSNEDNQFKIRWVDSDGIEREKIYIDYSQARKAYKWLNDNGAVADMAVVKRMKVSDAAEDASMFPVKEK